MNLLRIADLTPHDVQAIWRLAAVPPGQLRGCVGWSFEGNGVRTRTTFLQAFRDLGLSSSELPNVLKTAERPCDLAGYLDPFYDLYVIREADHARLTAFAAHSTRPVINAMSQAGHPCEVLADAYYVQSQLRPLPQARICLWGPTTNVLRSWHELAGVLGFQLHHVCDPRFHEAKPNVVFSAVADFAVDLVITDGWPGTAEDARWSLTREHLDRMGTPKLLPTPPFSIGRELAFDPLTYAGFVGYQQKAVLVPVQRAIVAYAVQRG